MTVGVGEHDRVNGRNTASLEGRVVRYSDLVPCTNAFIDTRTPGSDAKENFTIVGPGVAENPDQFVHITEAHGFNIGGARQPPHCTNSQHSHDTAEVFVVHSGRWRFTFGEHGEDAQVEASAGDIVSFPTQTFRGFANIGDQTAFLWSVLGGDDPGRVLWAPRVFEMAKQYGLILLEDGSLVDTTLGQVLPPEVKPMPVTSSDAVAKLRRMRPDDEAEIIARAPLAHVPGETLIIGDGGQLPSAEGFTLSRIWLGEGEVSPSALVELPEVLFVQAGAATITVGDGIVDLGPGDTMTMPIGSERSYRAIGEGAELIVVRGTR